MESNIICIYFIVEFIRSNHVDRMKDHIAQCHRNVVDEPIPDPNAQGNTATFTTSSESSSLQPTAIPLKSSTESFYPWKKYYFTNKANAAKKKLDLLVAKYFYANEIPFSTVEHSNF